MAIKTNKIKLRKNKSSTRKQKQVGGADRYGYLPYRPDVNSWDINNIQTPEETVYGHASKLVKLVDHARLANIDNNTQFISEQYLNHQEKELIGEVIVPSMTILDVDDCPIKYVIRVKTTIDNDLLKTSNFISDEYVYIIVTPGAVPSYYKYCKIPSAYLKVPMERLHNEGYNNTPAIPL